MCGIAGVLNLTEREPVERQTLRRMLAAIRHRGPDEFGIYRDAMVGLASARLSIIDLTSGTQPIGNEEGTVWIVFNGEIFNYLELRADLEANGHRFSTNSDTEVIVHLYEDHGPECLQYLNGQFAIALWDTRSDSLFLARDRLGIRPLFYTLIDGRLIFGSEIKALLAVPGVSAQIDPTALEQIFTYWSTLAPRTVFKDIYEIPPACYTLVRDGVPRECRYWTPDFGEELSKLSLQEVKRHFELLLIDATRLRLRADVPVGAYLSGGLDSSLMAAIIYHFTDRHLETFSISFSDSEFDESPFQLQMARLLGTRSHVIDCTMADIGRVFPEVIWHSETPILRTGPAPLFLLSKLVNDRGLKVVLTGEGADEILAGYGIFKEMKVRRFWARHPDSRLRPLLLKRLYPNISRLSQTGDSYLSAFFRRGLTKTDSPCYSHALRWRNTARARRFLLQDSGSSVDNGSWSADIGLPADFSDWSHLAQAQYLEMTIFLPEYLLSSQGDRIAMAHSVEGRFPFLDHRLVEFCNHLPANLKLRVLTEKWLLKQAGKQLLPPEIWQRPKRPYRAPIHRCFFGPTAPDYVRELLSDAALRKSELFKPEAVAQLARKGAAEASFSEVDDMALAGILSTQLVHQQFVEGFSAASLPTVVETRVIDRVVSPRPARHGHAPLSWAPAA